MVDELRVRQMLDRLGVEIDALRRLARLDPGELLRDDDLLAAVKYRFIVAIEVCIDVGRHVVASEGLRAPLDYADAFAVLADAGLLDPAIAAELRDTARFRNLLVHGVREGGRHPGGGDLAGPRRRSRRLPHRSRPGRRRLTGEKWRSHRPEPRAART